MRTDYYGRICMLEQLDKSCVGTDGFYVLLFLFLQWHRVLVTKSPIGFHAHDFSQKVWEHEWSYTVKSVSRSTDSIGRLLSQDLHGSVMVGKSILMRLMYN